MYYSEESKEKHSFYLIRYVNFEDSTDIFPIGFKVLMEGKNVDLEIEGTPMYYFSIAQGKFLDLFPFWHNFTDHQADAEVISKRGRSSIKMNNRTFTLKKESGLLWTITMNKY